MERKKWMFFHIIIWFHYKGIKKNHLNRILLQVISNEERNFQNDFDILRSPNLYIFWTLMKVITIWQMEQIVKDFPQR